MDELEEWKEMMVDIVNTDFTYVSKDGKTVEIQNY